MQRSHAPLPPSTDDELWQPQAGEACAAGEAQQPAAPTTGKPVTAEAAPEALRSAPAPGRPLDPEQYRRLKEAASTTTDPPAVPDVEPDP